MKGWTFKGLAREITRREGKKRQVNIAQVSEILRCLCDILSEDSRAIIPIVRQMGEALLPDRLKKKAMRK